MKDERLFYSINLSSQCDCYATKNYTKRNLLQVYWDNHAYLYHCFLSKKSATDLENGLGKIGRTCSLLSAHFFEVEFMRLGVRPHMRKKKLADVDAGASIKNIGEVFKGFGSLIDIVSEMAEKEEEKAERTGEIKTPGGRAMYGISIKKGGAGLEIERFGNIVRETEKGPIVEEGREPFVDIFEEGDNIEVIAELPGVEEKDISCEIKDNVLIINACGDGRKYSKKVLLPCKAARLKTVYKNGIFKLTLKKEKEEKRKTSRSSKLSGEINKTKEETI